MPVDGFNKCINVCDVSYKILDSKEKQFTLIRKDVD